MGASCSHMNTWALGRITRCTKDDLLLIFDDYLIKKKENDARLEVFRENRKREELERLEREKRILSIEAREEEERERRAKERREKDEQSVEENEENDLFRGLELEEINFKLLQLILHEKKLFSKDVETLENFFYLLDSKNRNIIPIKSLLISFAPFVCSSLLELVTLAFTLFDYTAKRKFLRKTEIIFIFQLLNDTLFNVGDIPMVDHLLNDFINSVYTSIGKPSFSL